MNTIPETLKNIMSSEGIKCVNVSTTTVNKWWDSLSHNDKNNFIERMNLFHWGSIISISAISKFQKNELYQQVFNLNNKFLRN